MDTLSMVAGFGFASYIFFTHAKIYMLEQKIKSLPSIEQMAKEIMKVKLPISELPSEMKEMLAQYVTGMPNHETPMPPPIQKNKRENYIG